MGKVLDEWAVDTQEFVRTKLPHLIVVAIIGFVLSRLLSLITARMIRIAEVHAASRGRVAQVKTLAGVIRTTGLAIIGAIVGLQFLDAVGVNLAPLLASAGIAGVAIGLAAQNIVKDMLNGTLILIEDQFNVGDAVTLAGVTGTVEAMTLRKTTVRGGDGTLYVIPNSQITTVANQSVDYLGGDDQCECGFLGESRQGDGTVEAHCDGRPQQQGIPRPCLWPIRRFWAWIP